MRVVACYAIKGGVGKTSTAVNLAHLAARQGLRTLLWDLDPQGSATYLFRVRPRVRGGAKGLVRGRRTLEESIKGTDTPGLDLVPADFRYRNLDLELDTVHRPTRVLRDLLEPLAAEYDLVILDCPPSVSLASESVVRAADLLLVPVIPAPLAVRSLDQLVEFLDGMGADDDGTRRPDLLAFLSMVDRRKKLHRDLAASLIAERDDLSPVVLPALAAVEQMAEERAPVAEYAPRSDAAVAYRRLWDEVASRLGLLTDPTGA